MPRFYFDVINGHGLEEDQQGLNLLSADAVPMHAAIILTDIARDEIPGVQAAEVRITVRDEASSVVYEANMTFSSEWRK